MNQQNYSCKISANVSAEEAFDGINNVAGWWATNVEGSTENAGDVFTVRFSGTFGAIKILEAIPGKKILWKVIDCYLDIFKDKTQWKGTKISWEISAAGGSTQIIMTHIGLVPEIECYKDCENGWNFFVGQSLYKLLTEQRGLPGIGIRATIANAGRVYEGTLFSKNDPLPDFPEEYILVDVKELAGEHVVSAYSVDRLDKTNFNSQKIRGDHYMLVANKSLTESINPLKDLVESIK